MHYIWQPWRSSLNVLHDELVPLLEQRRDGEGGDDRGAQTEISRDHDLPILDEKSRNLYPLFPICTYLK